ncbi:MAG: PD40 domain-containing protein [Bacteroidetes bacterium]|nr:PD40 domain-containing protein [Bacteroidota bacterium]
MIKIFASLFCIFIASSCGSKTEQKSGGEKSGDTKLNKSDSVQSYAQNKVPADLPKFKMTFEKEGGVYLVNSDLSDEKYLYKGYDNLISPDGKKVVHTQSNQDGSRNIALYDVESKSVKTLKSPTGKQSFDASFSPDSKKIAFCNFSGKKWNIAVVNIDDTGFFILSDKYKTDLFCPTFSPDGNSILCQDMQNFIELDLKGNILQTIPLKSITGDKQIYFSSANKGYFVNGKKEILFDADTQDFFETAREPISNIYLYSIASKSLKNITDKNISSYDPFPTSDGKYILFSAYTKDDLSKSLNPQDMEPVITSWIYIMKTDGSEKAKLLRGAYEPSASSVQ